MSRSRRKSPIVGITTADSDRPFKRAEHRRERTAVRMRLTDDADHATLPHAKRYGDPWRGEKDGKHWLDREHRARSMRK